MMVEAKLCDERHKSVDGQLAAGDLHFQRLEDKIDKLMWNIK
jgi:hypothetical protein